MGSGRFRVAVAAMAVVVSGCAAALLGGAGSGGYRGSSSGGTVEDRAITQAVKSKLAAAPDVTAADVNVATYQGVVSLYGDVRTAAQRAAAERVTRSVKGVKGVENQLRVK